VQFDFQGPVEIKVEKMGSEADSVILRPERYSYTDRTRTGSFVTFTIQADDPAPSVDYVSRKISVEFQDSEVNNLHEAPLNGLMIFANEPQDPAWVPDSTASNVFLVPEGRWDREVPADRQIVYFRPGVYHIADSIWYVPSFVDQVYLDGGAVVKGLCYIQDNPDFLVNGRGVLSGFSLPQPDKIPYTQGSAVGQDARMIFFRQGCERMKVEGITLMNHNSHTVTGWFRDPLIRNIKIIGWVHNSDGTRTGNGLVEECFFHCDDDAVWVFDTDGVVRNCVFWHYRNGGCFQFGWGGGNNSGVRVSHIDVIHAEWSVSNTNPNNGVFNLRLQNPSDGEQRDFLFEDIRVETPVLRVFDFDMVNETKGDGGTHRMRDILFRDIRARMLTSGSRAWNYFEPWDRSHGFRNIRFENLEINGLQLTESNWREARFTIDPRAVPELYFDNPDSIPRVIITYPEHLSEVDKGDTLLIATLAEDPDGSIDSVSIHNNESLIEVTREPYHGFYYPVTTTRDMNLSATATDNEGNSYTFGPILISVQGTHQIPGRIEAEDYEDVSGIQTEPTSDTGEGLNLGFINSGDYATYKVRVEEAGSYLTVFRVASQTQGGSIEVYKSGTLVGSVEVQGTGGWQQWESVTAELDLAAGGQDLMLYFRGGEGFLFNLNWFEFNAATQAVGIPGEEPAVHMFPNPARDFLHIRFDRGVPFEFQLCDLNGTILWGTRFEGSIEIPLPGHLGPGLYLVRLVSGEGSHVRKLVIQ
jgi:hypothetical protein